MTDGDHQELLTAVKSLKGMAIVCGYPSEMYTEVLGDFETFGTTSRISAGRGTALRPERIWLNHQCSKALAQQSLFA